MTGSFKNHAMVEVAADVMQCRLGDRHLRVSALRDRKPLDLAHPSGFARSTGL